MLENLLRGKITDRLRSLSLYAMGTDGCREIALELNEVADAIDKATRELLVAAFGNNAVVLPEGEVRDAS